MTCDDADTGEEIKEAFQNFISNTIAEQPSVNVSHLDNIDISVGNDGAPCLIENKRSIELLTNKQVEYNK